MTIIATTSVRTASGAAQSPPPLAPLAPAIRNYPLAPHNDRAADFNTCVNNSPFDPIANQLHDWVGGDS